MDIGAGLGGLDFELGSKISGSRFVVLQGQVFGDGFSGDTTLCRMTGVTSHRHVRYGESLRSSYTGLHLQRFGASAFGFRVYNLGGRALEG